MKVMVEREKEHDSGIMRFPIIEEEEIIKPQGLMSLVQS